VPTPDHDDQRDDRFEAYLRQFRPLAGEPFPMEKPKGATRLRPVFVACAAAVILCIAVALGFHDRDGGTQSTQAVDVAVRREQMVNTEPMTIRSANALLATAPSFEAAIDEIASTPQATPLPKDKHSALDMLSKEETKL
jgi:hypothetical protein